MDWIWKIDQLMSQANIRRTSTLAAEIKRFCPDLKRSVSSDTLHRMIEGNLIEIRTVGILAICQYFRLHSIAQLVDLDTAPPPILPPTLAAQPIEIEFRLKSLITELHLSQKQIREKSGCSPVTINGLYHGRNNAINFRVLKQVSEAICMLSSRPLTRCRPYSITDMIEIVNEKSLAKDLLPQNSTSDRILICNGRNFN